MESFYEMNDITEWRKKMQKLRKNRNWTITEFPNLSTNGSNRRIDILAYDEKS